MDKRQLKALDEVKAGSTHAATAKKYKVSVATIGNWLRKSRGVKASQKSSTLIRRGRSLSELNVEIQTLRKKLSDTIQERNKVEFSLPF